MRARSRVEARPGRETSLATNITGPPIVRVQGVHKRYGTGTAERRVLDDLSIDVEAGGFGIVLGVSGSGKTTLLNLIGGLDRPDRGAIEVCGTTLDGLSETGLSRFRRTNIGFIFQSCNLLPTLTAIENVEAALELTDLFPPREACERAGQYLEAVGLGSRCRAFPAELSGGEQQRVAIARALAKHPPLVLADEPTGNLDGDTAAEIWALMRSMCGGTGATFLIATHDRSAIVPSDRVYRIERGSLAPVGDERRAHAAA
jgi:putative ABC transport system ATP-binding protein